jgi:L-amino acid N-acyltransferase YncA
MSPDIVIRKAAFSDAAACAEINLQSWLHTYKGIIADSTLEKMNLKDLQKKWSWRFTHPDPAVFCLVAERFGKVAGYLLCGPNRNRKFHQQQEVMAMYISEEHRRIGIGKKLFAAAVAEMRSQSIPSFLVFAIRGNVPAHLFYASFFPHTREETTLEIDGVLYKETCYGWNDLLSFG